MAEVVNAWVILTVFGLDSWSVQDLFVMISLSEEYFLRTTQYSYEELINW